MAAVWLPDEMWQCIAAACIRANEDASVLVLALTSSHVRLAVTRACARLPGMAYLLQTSKRMALARWRERIFDKKAPALQNMAMPWNLCVSIVPYARWAKLAACLSLFPDASRALILALCVFQSDRRVGNRRPPLTNGIVDKPAERGVLICLLVGILNELRPGMPPSEYAEALAPALYYNWAGQQAEHEEQLAERRRFNQAGMRGLRALETEYMRSLRVVEWWVHDACVWDNEKHSVSMDMFYL